MGWLEDMKKRDPELAEAYAVTGNQSRPHLKAMVKALSLHPLLNTAEDKARLEAAQFILAYKSSGTIPGRTDYPKIETWVPHNDSHACRVLVTTRFATVFEARRGRAAELGVSVVEIAGRRVVL